MPRMTLNQVFADDAQSSDPLLQNQVTSQALDLFDAIDGPCTCGAPKYKDANCPYCNSSTKAREAIETLGNTAANLLAALAMGPLELAATYGPDTHPDEPVIDAARKLQSIINPA